jgi:hypothetical protein
MKIQISDSKLIIDDRDLFSSSLVIFDAKTECIHIKTRRFLFFDVSKDVLFSEVVNVITKEDLGDNLYDIDQILESLIILEGMNGEELLRWNFYNDHCFFSKVLFAIYKIMEKEFTRRALLNGSVRCKSCSRIISKTSEWCIYCGKSKT